MTITVYQSDKGEWYVLSDDDERVIARFNTARHAASQLIYEHLGSDRELTLRFVPYGVEEHTT